MRLFSPEGFQMIARSLILTSALLFGGCAEMGSGLMYLNDAMAMEEGGYWDDQHMSEVGGEEEDCPFRVDLGRVNNQTYVRIANLVDYDRQFTIIYNSGLETEVYLSGGETSDYYYTTPSIVPESYDFTCEE
jgi:hypothetical protein